MHILFFVLEKFPMSEDTIWKKEAYSFLRQNNFMYICKCKLFFVFMQNGANRRSSLVSKSLPVKKNILVTCLFSVGK